MYTLIASILGGSWVWGLALVVALVGIVRMLMKKSAQKRLSLYEMYYYRHVLIYF